VVQGRARSRANLAASILVGVLLIAATLGALTWVDETEPSGDCSGGAADTSVVAKPSILALEFAGTEERAQDILECWSASDRESVADGLNRDTVFIALYALTLAFWCWQGTRWFRTDRSRGFGRALIPLIALAAALDLVENHFLRDLFSSYEANGTIDTSAVEHALTATIPKWIIALVAVGYSFFAVLGCIRRLFRRTPDFDSHVTPHPADRGQDEDDWSWAARPPLRERWSSREGYDPAHSVGICLSGGGIRSATFNLGVLQSLQRERYPGDQAGRTVLGRADFLAAVSGGAYIAGAYQTLLHQAEQAEAERARAADADPGAAANQFEPGSPEEDWLRRHGRYLADSPTEWLHAVFRFLTGVVLNFTVFFLLLFVVARPLGWVQAELLFPIGRFPNATPHVTRGMWDAVLWVGALSLACVLVAVISRPSRLPRHRYHGLLWRVATALAVLGLVILALVLVLPMLARLVHTLLELPSGADSGDNKERTLFGLIVISSAGIAPSVFATVQAITNKHGGWVRRILPRLAGLLLALLALVIFAFLVDDAARLGPRGILKLFDHSELSVWISAVAVLVALYLVADQTQWSLHPLYKRRLSRAFAIQRKSPAEAVELDYDTPTTLSTWAKPVNGYPQLIVCAAANVSGSELAPPGRRVVPYVFTDECIGSPELTWARTEDFEAVLGRQNRGDGSLRAAAAISGAAFASAMGRHSKPGVNVLLAVTNARLGVWLPHPKYITQLRQHTRGERPTPELWVTTRRFTYLLKEVIGLYDQEDRYVYVTDGGHLDNLGLIELLRRRCKTILCFDASGGEPSFAGTLTEAIALAREKLGVLIDINTEPLAPASAITPTGRNERRNELSKRFSDSAVIVGKITYPGDTEPTATLVFAKAVLVDDDDTPADVLTYANRVGRFPNDPTSDQFFDHAQFASYHALGAHIGARAVAALIASSQSSP
jgi:hypothetical protein